MGQTADNHIFRFVQSKFGYIDETDFETRLYLCLPIFQPLGMDYYTGMSSSGALPLYIIISVLQVTLILWTACDNWINGKKNQANNPMLCYHSAQSLILAVLAASTLRMKCFWSPYICIMAAVAVGHFDFWNKLSIAFPTGEENPKKYKNGDRLLVNFLRHVVIVSVIVSLFLANK